PAQHRSDHRRGVCQQATGEMPVTSAAGGRSACPSACLRASSTRYGKVGTGFPSRTCAKFSTTRLAKILFAVAAVMLLIGMVDAPLAQAGPFGVPRGQPAPAAPTSGVLGWIFAKQAEFYRQFSGLIRAAKADGTATWGLFGLSFLYGIFHAAGPGHGKAVIS